MKKILLTTFVPYAIIAQQTVAVKANWQQCIFRNHHLSFLRFWNWAEENCRCSQNLWRREMLLNETSKHS